MGEDMIQTPEEFKNCSTGSFVEGLNLLLQTYRVGLMQKEHLIFRFKNEIQTEYAYDLFVQQGWNVEYCENLAIQIWMS
jgi:hypothetical protein